MAAVARQEKSNERESERKSVIMLPLGHRTVTFSVTARCFAGYDTTPHWPGLVDQHCDRSHNGLRKLVLQTQPNDPLLDYAIKSRRYWDDITSLLDLVRLSPCSTPLCT